MSIVEAKLTKLWCTVRLTSASAPEPAQIISNSANKLPSVYAVSD